MKVNIAAEDVSLPDMTLELSGNEVELLLNFLAEEKYPKQQEKKQALDCLFETLIDTMYVYGKHNFSSDENWLKDAPKKRSS